MAAAPKDGDLVISRFVLATAIALAGARLALLAMPARAEDAEPKSPNLPVPKAEALLGVDPDYDHVIAFCDHDKERRSGDWMYRYSLDAGGGALTRSASTSAPNTKDSQFSIDHDAKTRGDRGAQDIEGGFGVADARFSAEALAKEGGKPLTRTYGDDRGVFDPKPQRRELGWSLESGDLRFMMLTAQIAKHGQFALCPRQVALGAVASSCTLCSLKGFAGAFDYACDAKEAP
jgi:hypothetical protein